MNTIKIALFALLTPSCMPYLQAEPRVERTHEKRNTQQESIISRLKKQIKAIMERIKIEKEEALKYEENDSMKARSHKIKVQMLTMKLKRKELRLSKILEKTEQKVR